MMIAKSISKNSIMLGLFAVLVAAGLAITEYSTRELRAESLRKVQSRALEEIIPASRHDNMLLDDTILVDDQEYLHLKEAKKIYVARMNGEVVAFILPTRAPDAYSGTIDSIVGINIDGTIAGVRIIQHQETPGLGDKIELKKSPWILGFNGKSLDNPVPELWRVKKDKGIYDQFTGATITPRAVVQSVYNALLYYRKHQEELLQQAGAQPTPIAADSSTDTETHIEFHTTESQSGGE